MTSPSSNGNNGNHSDTHNPNPSSSSFTPGSFSNPIPQIPTRSTRTSFSASIRPSVSAEPTAAGQAEPSSRLAISTSRPSSALASTGIMPGSPTNDRASNNNSPDVEDEGDPDDLDGGPLRPDESAFSAVAELPDEEKARVLRRHLVSADERVGTNSPALQYSPTGTPAAASTIDDAGESTISRRDVPASGSDFPIPYDAPGGDVTHQIYKWEQNHRPRRPTRSASFSHADRSDIVDPTVSRMKEPGGFRRNFLTARAQERGVEEPPMTGNFVDFLYLYGHFAGEDLDEDEDLEDEDDAQAAEEGRSEAGPSRATERTPLLQRTASKQRHKRSKSVHGKGTATVTQAVLMLLKGFIGTGVMFMGRAFFNGGMLFSTIVMLSMAAISLWSFLLLVNTFIKVPGSFGDIGGILYGNWLRVSILFSITVSQIGFVAAYTIFVAENLQAFLQAVSDCKWRVSTRDLIFGQLVLFLPLSMIRNLAKLSGTALVADVFILVGLLYISGTEISLIATRGVADIQMFNRDNFPLLIGTAVFAFEGIGLVIPIAESMKEPHKIGRALSGVMFVVAVLFTGFGVLGYAAYGSEVKTVVLVNLPQEEKFVQATSFLYSLAILLSIPLQLFPAVRIMETGLFSRSGKHNPRVKWQKNLFRACTVIMCAILSWAGSTALDKFVSLVGAFACIPLCFIYPPMLHLRGCATTRKAKILDCILLAFGVLVGVYTTIQTLRSLFASSAGGSPEYGMCN